MKKITLCLVLSFLLDLGFGYAQMGIGAPLPNPSTQLEIVSNCRGVLFLQVALTATTEKAENSELKAALRLQEARLKNLKNHLKRESSVMALLSNRDTKSV